MAKYYPKGSSRTSQDVASKQTASANPATAPGQDAESQRVMAISQGQKHNAKHSSGSDSTRKEAPQQGVSSIASNEINKPATPRPYGSTADMDREKS